MYIICILYVYYMYIICILYVYYMYNILYIYLYYIMLYYIMLYVYCMNNDICIYIYLYEQGVWGSGDPAYFYIHIYESVNLILTASQGRSILNRVE